MKRIRLALLPVLLTACTTTQTTPTQPTPSQTAPSAGPQLVERMTVQVPELSTVTVAEAPRYDPVDGQAAATYRMPALAAPTRYRRSEGVWDSKTPWQEGDLVVFEARVRATLGAEAADAQKWHILAQLQGPVPSRTGEACNVNPGACWVSPPVSLGIIGGKWRVQGGLGAPGGPQPKQWTLGEFRNGQWEDLRLEILISHDPAKGYVSASLNGVKTVDKFRLPAGTAYADQNIATMVLKTGLYTGYDIQEFKEVVMKDARFSLYR